MNVVRVELGAASPQSLHLAVTGWVDLVARGLTDDRSMPFNAGSSALIAIGKNGQEDALFGILVFSIDQGFRRVWVDFSYVAPEFRGQGAYTALWGAIVKFAEETKCLTIESATSMNNTVMRAIAKKQHRQEGVVHLLYKVNP